MDTALPVETISEKFEDMDFSPCKYENSNVAGDGIFHIMKESELPRPEFGPYWYTNNGKVVQLAPNGQAFRGSGCLITPRLVLTAAHVVYSHKDGGRATAADFIPNWPFDTEKVQARRIYVMNDWVEKERYQADLALIYLERPISSDGMHGVVINSPFEKAENHFGWSTVAYPASMPGYPECNEMVVDGGPKSKKAFQYGNLYLRAGIVAWDRADIGPGASGGPWVSNNSHPSSVIGKVLLPGNKGSRLYAPLIGSVSSFIDLAKPGYVYGPDLKDEHGEFILSAISDAAADPGSG